MLTYKYLRNYTHNHGGKQIIEWTKSKIVEIATVEKNGAIRITNVVSGKSYTLPRKYQELEIRLVKKDELVSLGQLLPKSLR